MQNVKVAISNDFLDSFAKLPKKIQGKVTEFIAKFRNDPTSPGINYEKLKYCVDKKMCSVRIDDTYRAIVVKQEESGVYLLLWVDHHDEAYQWASRKKCDISKTNGAIQLYDVQVGNIEQNENKEKGFFEDIRQKDLIKLGVPEDQIDFVYSIRDKDHFVEMKSSFASDTYENLSWIAEGFAIEEVLEMLASEQEEQSTSQDLLEALENSETLKSFVVIEGEEDLRKIMAEPLEKWRVFLHPTQRKIANKTYSGPARVLGTAGTGKTVVAMHRAKYLASRINEDERILFTTYTANLANDIRSNLKKICSVDELKKIEVKNIDAWVVQYLKEAGFTAQIEYDDQIKELWDSAIILSKVTLPFEADFYEDEWNRVAIANEALSLEKYVKVRRNGRGIRLDRKQRMQIWKVFETYQNLMKEKQIRDVNTAMYECRLLIEKSNTRRKYVSVIVDEAQDLSDNALRLLRTLAGEKHENDMFIVGDSHQRIYKNKAVLSKSGIDIRGRSSILKINYRTTEEIRKTAFALLNGIPFDNLDEEFDLDDKCQSLTHGLFPEVKSFQTANEEMDFIVREVLKLVDGGVDLRSICIVARTNRIVQDYAINLTLAGIQSYTINTSKNDDQSQEGVRLATMHRVKGLEFQYVFVAAVNNNIVPLKSAISHVDKVSEKESLTSEKCLLYVALTRAQKGAYITNYGKKSVFIK